MKISPFFRRFTMGATVGLIATVAYRSIQRITVARSAVRYECWTWHWMPFHAGWIWAYISMFLLVGLPWFLLREMRQVNRFAVCLLATAAVGWVTFMIFPTACARPPTEGQPFYYVLLQTLDRPNNCFPCLHSAFSVLAVCALVQGGSDFFRRTRGQLLLAVWLVLICVSIVGLRQHTDVDMIGGFMLGGLVAWAGWRA